ncbi:aminotransferase class I/II-fold pyridoxal phosphate-dependent enzyme [Candidatus Gottesmanbacteria bacterium]|nr:aminotransferase class I/II-fold pyridoxal phosphate-dependent enzyme [Candidatus Gottesmanbacteria bacterium]
MDTSGTINLQYSTIKNPLPDFIYEGLQKFSNGANLYRPQPQQLVEKLTRKHNIPKEMIYLTAGCDEAIQMFAHAYGRHAYIFTPTYTVYTDVEVFGGKLTQLYSLTNDAYSIRIQPYPEATLIYLANPNNPSGFTQKKNVIELIKANAHAIVVIDEAYGDFADLSVVDEVINYPHMAVFRSFSKSYGMAGNRIGYVIAHPHVIERVKKYSQWANVSYLSVGAAMVALDHEKYFIKMREDISKRRDQFLSFLKTLKFSVFPSYINATLIKFPTETEAIQFVAYLKDNNIICSHGNGNSNVGLTASFVRFAIGTEEQMIYVQKVLQNYNYRKII